MRLRDRQLLVKDMNVSSEGIAHLLHDYGQYVSQEQASFIRAYTRALEQDFEHAMTRGENDQLRNVLEDLQELEQDTFKRLVEVKSLKSVQSDL